MRLINFLIFITLSANFVCDKVKYFEDGLCSTDKECWVVVYVIWWEHLSWLLVKHMKHVVSLGFRLYPINQKRAVGHNNTMCSALSQTPQTHLGEITVVQPFHFQPQHPNWEHYNSETPPDGGRRYDVRLIIEKQLIYEMNFPQAQAISKCLLFYWIYQADVVAVCSVVFI